jgi:FdhD protein
MSPTITPADYRPQTTAAGLTPTHRVVAVDQFGVQQTVCVANEIPLTLKVDDREVVTLMTLGMHPEELVLGFIRNQRLIRNIEEIKSVEVNWHNQTAAITTQQGKGISDWQEKLSKRTMTTGCGQGTVFSCTLDELYEKKLPRVYLRQSVIYDLLKSVSPSNQIYRQSGAIHGCGLCKGSNLLMFVEDVSRHNAADAISGRMWLDRIPGQDKIFYTTGRLTSEIVMKAASMEIPVLLSRSGITLMALEIAGDLNITMIARAKGNRFLLYNGVENIIFDRIPLTS